MNTITNKQMIIYHYLDLDNNRRPLDIKVNDGYEVDVSKNTVDAINEKYPHTINNLYVTVDGIIYKLA